MPNNCYNSLRISGDEKVIQEIVEKHFPKTNGEHFFEFNTLVQYPEAYKIQDAVAKAAREKGDYTVKDGYNSGGYDWCNENWSTKWDAYDQDVQNYGETIHAEFYTAWSPPENVIKVLIESTLLWTFFFLTRKQGWVLKEHMKT